MRIEKDAFFDALVSISWESGRAFHRDRVLATRLNVWRDAFAQALAPQLLEKRAGDSFSLRLSSPMGERDEAEVYRVKRGDLRFPKAAGNPVPAPGRFYPRGILTNVPNVFPGNRAPFRVIDMDEGFLSADFNHPLAGIDLSLSVEIIEVRSRNQERGGSCRALDDLMETGPGMQARFRDLPTDFFTPGALSRADENPDGLFYEKPRMVQHLDATARERIEEFYAGLLRDGMDVLDLMASFDSHLPEAFSPASVAGLGLNAEELAANPRLSSRIVQDLNESPEIPLPGESLDAVLCTASVEYLSDPLAAFASVKRVLRPGGVFALTFSNRWFPPKAIRLWSETHEFERMGFVLELFLRSGGFTGLCTESLRGLPRPGDDKYADSLIFSDPLFCVWGVKE